MGRCGQRQCKTMIQYGKNEPGQERTADDELVQCALKMQQATADPKICPEAENEEVPAQPCCKVRVK